MVMPKVLSNNAFNVIGLQSGSTLGEVRKRSQHLISLSRINEMEAYDSDLGDLSDRRTESGIRAAIEKLSTVRDRLAETFFWFEITTVEDADLLRSLSQGHHDAAANRWRQLSTEGNWLAKKNYALLLFAQSYNLKSIELFESCVRVWSEIFLSDAFWRYYTNHYAMNDDVGTDLDSISEFRKSLADRLSKFTNEWFHYAQNPAAVGIFFRSFHVLGDDLEQNIFSALARRIQSTVDEITHMSDQHTVDLEKIASSIQQLRLDAARLSAFNIETYSPVKALKEKLALRLRSASIKLFNTHEDTMCSTLLLELSGELNKSPEHQLLVVKEREILNRSKMFNDFFAELAVQLAAKSNRECYVHFWSNSIDVPPGIQSSRAFEFARNESIILLTGELLDIGLAHLTSDNPQEAKLKFDEAYVLLDRHLDDLGLDAEVVRARTRSFGEETSRFNDGSQFAIVDRVVEAAQEDVK
ncbi:MAG: hypothetical protein EOP06_08535, partial [Proteobacteria bacterium]